MDELLKPVKTTRTVKTNIQKFENLSLQDTQENSAPNRRRLSEVPEVPTVSVDTVKVLNESLIEGNAEMLEVAPKGLNPTDTPTEASFDPRADTITSPQQALDVLRTQHDGEAVEAVVKYLNNGIQKKHAFNVQIPSPEAAQIVNLLVNDIIPDIWPVLKDNRPEDRNLQVNLLLCMTSSAGIGAFLARIQSLMDVKSNNSTTDRDRVPFQDTMTFFNALAKPTNLLSLLLKQTNGMDKVIGPGVWSDITSLFAGSKILNILQSAAAVPDLNVYLDKWMLVPDEYVAWLGLNVAHAALVIFPPSSPAFSQLADLLHRAMSLGHSERLVTEVYSNLLFGKKVMWTVFRSLNSCLPRISQAAFLRLTLQSLSRKVLNKSTGGGDGDKLAIGAVASLVSHLVNDNQSMRENVYLQEQMIEWLTNPSSPHPVKDLETRRALIVVLAEKEGRLQKVLERSMKIFSDKLHIKHDSVLQQQALAQVILLTVGYLYRMNPQSIIDLSNSSSYLLAVSNRLAASLPPARFLGMIVGMAISALVDPPEKRMRFESEEIESEGGAWWLGLTSVEDVIESIDILKTYAEESSPAPTKAISRKVAKIKPKPKSRVPVQEETVKIISIEEINSDEDSSEDDLVPYQKPDSDPEDSDEDPTLINRSKPRAPIYISELIKGLTSFENIPLTTIALETAPGLIRRKASFGSELSESIDSVVSALINLSEDNTEPDIDFTRLQQQSLTACLVAQPSRVAPRLAAAYFEGDYSIHQRVALLTTLGLGARDLAGHDDNNTATQPSLAPSKTLPAHLLPIYTSPISALTTTHQLSALAPLASAVPNHLHPAAHALSTRTISSRPAIQARNQARQTERSKRIPKDLHRLLTDAIYLPLCCRMSVLLASGASSRRGGEISDFGILDGGEGVKIKNISVFEHHLVRLLLQTLLLVLVTLGPNAVQVPTVARETVLLLVVLTRNLDLSLDAAVLPAMMGLFVAVLDVCIDAGGLVEEGLVQGDMGEGVVGLIEWVERLVRGGEAGGRVPEVNGKAAGGTGLAGEMEGGVPWTISAAGVLVRWEEVRKRFQGRVLGLTAGMGMDGY